MTATPDQTLALFKTLVQKANEEASKLTPHALCVYAKGPHNKYERKHDIEQIGSATVFQYRGYQYLATANHVIESAKKRGEEILFFSKNKKFLTIKCKDLASGDMKILSSYDEDYAIIGLGSSPSMLPLAECEPVELDPHEKQHLGLALGYPCTKNKQRTSTTLDMKCLNRIGMIYVNNPERYIEDKINPETHFAMEYDKFSLSTEAAQERSIDLHGMSGGPTFVFNLAEKDGAIELRPFLLGITIEYGATGKSSSHLKLSFLIEKIVESGNQ